MKQTEQTDGRLYKMVPFRHSCDRSERECSCWLPSTAVVEFDDGEKVEVRNFVRYRHVRGLNRKARRSLARLMMTREERKLLKEMF